MTPQRMWSHNNFNFKMALMKGIAKMDSKAISSP